MTDDTLHRRSVIAAIGVAAATMAFRSGTVQAQAAPTAGFKPARHAQDAWLDGLPGKHRTVIDSFSVNGAGEALLFANNLHVANKAGYGLADADVAVVVTLRHKSTEFAFNNAMWAKYGAQLGEGLGLIDPKTKQAPTVNLFNTAGYGQELPNFGLTIDSVAKIGVHFAICQMATRRLAGQVAKAVGAMPDAIYDELVANIVPNGHMVAAGVIAVTRAQEYGYTVLVAG